MPTSNAWHGLSGLRLPPAVLVVPIALLRLCQDYARPSWLSLLHVQGRCHEVAGRRRSRSSPSHVWPARSVCMLGREPTMTKGRLDEAAV